MVGLGIRFLFDLDDNHLTEFIDSVTGMLDLCEVQGPEHDFAQEL
jgi:hypothetical protein